MGKAKDIILRPISAKRANAFIKRVHYSGKVTQNSQVHIGVFLDGILEGAFQFGPSLDKRKLQGLVANTKWNEFIELNRLAFTEALPRNSESRAISICMRLLRKHAPQLKWIVSFADACQCGDGTIYRASGFVLTGIKKNKSLWEFDQSLISFPPLKKAIQNGCVLHEMYFRSKAWSQTQMQCKGYYYSFPHKKDFLDATCANIIPGFQLRYVYFLDKSYRERLTVPEIPFSEIKEMGASMYKGKKISDSSDRVDTPGVHPGEGGSSPTLSLQV